MNLQQLKYFAELNKYKSISEAASSLYITQQGLSTSMSRLEAELKCKLFVRTSYGLQLTEQGEFFLEHARAMLEHYDVCMEAFGRSRASSGNIRIAAATGTMAEFGSRCVNEFRDCCPDCGFKIVETANLDCDRLVENGEVDLGFAVEEVDTERFEYVRLFSAPAAIVVGRDNPLAEKSVLTLGELENQPLVLLNESSKVAEQFLAAMEADGLNADVHLRVGDVFSIFRIASDTPLAGLTNVSVAEEINVRNTVVIPLDDERCGWHAGIIRRKSTELYSLAEKFYEYFRVNVPHRGLTAVSREDM